MIIRIFHLGEAGDALVGQSSLTHQKGIQVGHQDGYIQRFMQDVLGEHRDGIGFTAPDHALLLIEQIPGQARCCIREARLVEAVDAHRADGVHFRELALDGQVDLGGAVHSARGETGGGEIAAIDDRLRFSIRDGFSLSAERFKALLDDGHTKLIPHALQALRFEPVETLEYLRLEALARVILEDQELRLPGFSLDLEGFEDRVGLIQAAGSDGLDARGPQIADDLPIPHQHGAKFGGNDQDGELDGFEGLQLVVGFTEELGKDDRIGIRELLAEGMRIEKLSLLREQLFQTRQLEIKICITALNEVHGNQACFHEVTSVGWEWMDGYERLASLATVCSLGHQLELAWKCNPKYIKCGVKWRSPAS